MPLRKDGVNYYLRGTGVDRPHLTKQMEYVNLEQYKCATNRGPKYDGKLLGKNDFNFSSDS